MSGPRSTWLGVNGRIRTIGKTTGTADGVLNADFETFFASRLPGGTGTSDPRVRYDRRTSRWFVIMISVAIPNQFLVAVSNTATITAATTWTFLDWTNTRTLGGVGGAASCLGDYPTLGVDEDALYIGVNQFCGADVASPLTFDSTTLYVLNKPALTGGTLAVVQFDGLTNGSVRRHLHAAGRRQLRRQYQRRLFHRRRQPAGQPARAAPGRESQCGAEHLERHHGERAGHAAADQGAAPGRRAAPRRTRRPAAAGGDQERPLVDHAPDGGERQWRRRGQRRPERRALVRTGRARHHALGGAVGHGVRRRGHHAAQLLDGRHHAQRAGPRGARHVARRRERTRQRRLHGTPVGRSGRGHGHAPVVQRQHGVCLQRAERAR